MWCPMKPPAPVTTAFFMWLLTSFVRMSLLSAESMDSRAPRSNKLRTKQRHETRVVAQVTLPQPSGFRKQPENPFGAGFLHEPRRLPFGAGQEVKRSTHAHHDGPNPTPMTRHPDLLFG